MKLRPSSASVWSKCAAYPRMVQNVPEQETSDPAREGTCAAWVAEMVLTNKFPDCHAMVGEIHENGWLVTPDMAQHIQRYVDKLRSYGGEIHVERKVRLNDDVEGTPDGYGLLDDDTLRVDDLKYGFDPVEPTTEQIIIYAGAVLRLIGNRRKVRKVVLGIYQPRAYHPMGIHRTWTLWPEELMKHVQRIERAAEATKDPAAMATPGAHCKYCPAAATCAASAFEVYAVTNRMHHAQQRHMTPQEMSNELAFLDLAEALLKGRKNAVRAEAIARMESGERIPGWMKDSGRGQRRWTADAATVQMVTGLNPSSGKMVAPLELERRGADVDKVAMLTETPRTKAILKPMTQEFVASRFGDK